MGLIKKFFFHTMLSNFYILSEKIVFLALGGGVYALTYKDLHSNWRWFQYHL